MVISYKDMPKKASHADNASSELATFADLLANSEDYIEEQEDAFGTLVETYITQGRDDILQNALANIESDEGFDWLLDDIITYSQNRAVTKEDVSFLDADEMYDASLFLVPVILVLKPKSPLPIALKGADTICKSFRQNNLVHEARVTAMHPELLELDDVDVEPSQRREMLDYLVGIHSSKKTRSFKKSSEQLMTADDSHHVTLRYILVNTVSGMYSDSPFLPLSDEDADIEVFETSLEEWRVQFTEMLKQQIDAEDIFVAYPESFNDGLMEGVFSYHQLMLKLKAERAVYDCAKLHSICKAIVSAHASEDESEFEVLVGIYDDHHAMVANMSIPVPSMANKYDIDDYLSMAIQTLDDAKVDHVTQVDSVMPMSRCECCNEPEYPATQYPVKRIKNGVLH